MSKPKVNEVTWDFFHHNMGTNPFTNEAYAYRIDSAREHQGVYFRLRYIYDNKDKIKYFYGESAWMNLNRFINDMGDFSFNVDNVYDEMLDDFMNALADLKGSC